MKLFSDKNRPVHMGQYPTERLKRIDNVDLNTAPEMQALSFRRPEAPENIVNAMGEYQAMLDAIRDGLINKTTADIPTDPTERAHHIRVWIFFRCINDWDLPIG